MDAVSIAGIAITVICLAFLVAITQDKRDTE
jgi:hypothetical protein